VCPGLTDWGKIMHPTYPSKCAYIELKSGRVQAPAVEQALHPLLHLLPGAYTR